MPPERRLSAIEGYVTAIAAIGSAALVILLATAPAPVLPPSTATVVLTALVIAGELLPIQVQRRDQAGEITTSLTFAFALMVQAGAPIAVVALVVGSALADLIRRKGVSRVVFNTAQYVVALTGAALVVGGLSGPAAVFGDGSWTAFGLLLTMVGGAVAFTVNWMLTGTVVALAGGQAVTRALRADLPFTASTSGVLLTLAPVLVLIAHENVLLIPLLLTTVGALYLTARRSLDGRHEADHDQLTGLANRRLLDQRLRNALADGPRAALLIIDLDRFKQINDNFGHAVGDQVLYVIGRRIAASVRDSDLAARLGGDEFAILLPDPDDDLPEVYARRLLETFRTPVEVNGLPLEVGGSIGVAVGPEDGLTAEDLVRHADAAMYRAKQTGAGYVLAMHTSEEERRGRLTLLADMGRAIAADEFELHYQPVLHVGDGAVVGMEALVRWQHPAHGLIPPSEFMPLAEQTDLIAPLTRLVLDKALAQTRRWHDTGQLLRISVNLGVSNLYDVTFPADLDVLLRRHGIPPESLTLEITENTVMADHNRVRTTLARVADSGVRISIDDFGTGYSSLFHLKQLPVSQIKIDRSFVQAMHTDPEDALIVRSIIDLARNLGLHVTAEGVEEPEVYRMLAELGCDAVQGHLLAPPATAREVVMWLQGYQAPRELGAPAGAADGGARVVAFPPPRVAVRGAMQ